MSKKMFGAKRDEVTGEWRKLHNEEFNDLCSSPNMVQVIKSLRMRWTRYVACTEESRDVYRVLWGNLRERDHLEDPDVDERIILK